MKRSRGSFRKFLRVCTAPLAGTALVLGLAACDDGRPVSPDSPDNPPRPETLRGAIVTAHFDLPARPAPRRPGLM
jgi:hypothetical protein